MATFSQRLPVTRVCKCGCRQTFHPSVKRPGQEHIHGHKPKPAGAIALVKTSTPDLESSRARLDYKMALAIARREVDGLNREIDMMDDVIATQRGALDELLAGKDLLVSRHLTLSVSINALDAVVSGRSIIEKVAS
jgi:hypothetical protein